MTSRQSRPPSGPDGSGDLYKLLNVPHTATFQEITRAYRDAMKRAHPDRHRPEGRAAAEELAKELNRAYTTLSKAESRRAYDVQIKSGAIQEQIMGRYVSGVPASANVRDPFAEALRRKQTNAERAEQRRSDRSATMSIFLIFAAVAVIAIGFVVINALITAAFKLLF